MKKLIYLNGIATLILLISCAGLKVERGVQDNKFSSSSYPKIKIQISPEFKYIGKSEGKEYHEWVSGTGGTFHNYESYIFGQVATQNIIVKGVVMNFGTMDKGYYLTSLFKFKGALDIGFKELHGEKYQYAVRSSDPLYKHEEEFLLDKQIFIPNCILWKALGRRMGVDNDKRFYIYYFEGINFVQDKKTYYYRDWKNKDKLTNDQKSFLEEFINRSENSYQILE